LPSPLHLVDRKNQLSLVITILAMGFALTFIILHFQEAYATDYVIDETSCEELPVTGGSAIWSGSTCTIDGGILALSASDRLFVLDTNGVNLVISKSATIENDGHLQTELGSGITNYGTIHNRGSVGAGGAYLTNHGVIENSGQMSLGTDFVNSGQITNLAGGTLVVYYPYGIFTNSGTVANNGTIDAQNHLDNEGLIQNDNFMKIECEVPDINKGTINNTGIFDNNCSGLYPLINYGIVDTTQGTLNNYGTFENKCGSILIGSLIGNPPDNTPCGYSLVLFEGGSASDGKIYLGTPATAGITTDNPSLEKIVVRWIDPDGNTAREKEIPVTAFSLTFNTQDSFLPDRQGDWTVTADFLRGTDILDSKQIRFTIVGDFLIVDKSMIGFGQTVKIVQKIDAGASETGTVQWMNVTEPDGDICTARDLPEEIGVEGSLTRVYPTDFTIVTLAGDGICSTMTTTGTHTITSLANIDGVLIQGKAQFETSFFVVPESPIGAVVLIISSLAALGGFVYFRQHRPLGSH
jgi:hypothetical protein